MNAQLSNDTVEEIQQLTGKPISRGIDKSIQECLQELRDYKEGRIGNKKPQVRICTNTEDMAEE